MRSPDGEPMPRPVWHSEFGWLAVKPLPHAQTIRFYRNWTARSPERFAALFREALVGCEDITAETVGAFLVGRAAELERVISEGSELTNDDGGDEGGDETADDEPEQDMGMFSPPEGAMEKVEEYKTVDLRHDLMRYYGHTAPDIAGMLAPEIDEWLEGVERHEQRQEQAQEGGSDSETDSGGGESRTGNRGESYIDTMDQ